MNNVMLPTGRVDGRYHLYMNDADSDGNVVPGTARRIGGLSPNLITDSGMVALRTGNPFLYCRVGAGTSPPAHTDTGLASQVAVSQGSTQIAAGPVGEGYTSALLTYTFSQGAASGVLSEVGVSATSTGPLTSRALILDSEGSPTTITVDPIGILTVVYEFRLYLDAQDRVSEVTVEGVPRSVVTRVAGAGSASDAARHGLGGAISDNMSIYGCYTGVLGPAGTPAPGTLLPGGSSKPVLSPATLVGGVASVTATSKFTATTGVGTITVVAQRYSSGPPIPLKASFDPPVVKNNTKEFEIQFTRTWERA